ncbi:hypothetical protein A2526_03145 [candidate division WOR-1 bacterium RIFOXYD2_FULL_36_8]|uniref:Uncharacterized protein n=1 Tax=candidate division WOR-1 bacterium RIFOXYB2_FULL_36_35 TaxID=1802578 RepID=A0A1F4S0P8_UNCSA|nr:MAG: hypothetical protein A2230_02455 [candidate division WOR-1 bacterium RIFOXYA2_FULL_36_21]OGC13994.1 MAG: hypothetical protein A2290_06480 [candidate division WOR-1 bacterium RIFOXYB2_FULL_36_35]OGC16553.1 MAG: hypothetical protein A2282_06315 [candidate division WOR-1 bacterium RIFOXYA12_FULL_36_13]OGC41298.1 MAG: hypothetical protein A2526_03145 [candidate division WOR-1 bacterium RIFOXYD2_FULL_36_8]
MSNLMVAKLARNIFEYGGFCFNGLDSLDQGKGKYSNALSRALQFPPTASTHSLSKAKGELGSLGNLSERNNSDKISSPWKIFVANSTNPGRGHFTILSINGLITLYPREMDVRDHEALRCDVLWNAAHPVPQSPQQTLWERITRKPEPYIPRPEKTLKNLMHVFWVTGNNTQLIFGRGSVSAAFLLPSSDAMDLMRMARENPNNYHALLATLWPGYRFLHPLLNLGKMEIQEVVEPMASENRAFQLVRQGKRFSNKVICYNPSLP